MKDHRISLFVYWQFTSSCIRKSHSSTTVCSINFNPLL